MKKMEIDVVTIMNLCMELHNNHGVKIKVRNYFREDPPDPYFLFEHEPNEKLKEFVREYFEKEGGSVIFSGKEFVVYEKQEDFK